MNALAPVAPANATPAEPVLAELLLNFVAKAANNPRMNAEKLEVLLRMQRDIMAEDARLQFNRAMAAAQAEMVPVVRDAVNTATNSRYAQLGTVDAAVRPIYSRHGFSLTFNSESVEGNAYERIVCKVLHSAGHTERYQLEAALDVAGPNGRPNKTPLHGLGSLVSYLRRYLTCMIFNIQTADDNDGNRRQAPADAGRLTAGQLNELRRLLAECSADPAATTANERHFLAKMNLAECNSLDAVQPRDFGRIKNALLTKISVLAQRDAAAERAAAARQAMNGGSV